MNLPISWLKQFVNTTSSTKEIAEKLTLSGSEVEKIIRKDSGFSKVFVGQINKIESHPNADKLRIAYVSVGKGADLKIVCGAPNIARGQKVPVVMLGGEVCGIKIEPREIRGVKSHGMLCSQKELGLGDDHNGIFVLPQSAKTGAPLDSYLGLDDEVLEIDVTPNRPDCFSIYGLSREVAALFGKKALKRFSAKDFKSCSRKISESRTETQDVLSVSVLDKKLCKKYFAKVIQGIKVGPSPIWMQNRLRQMNIRPINNVVDATNYAMVEIGQPLHAFDANLISSSKIIVRPSKPGEKILALDGATYFLPKETLVIADQKRAIAIAGIMGGQESSVSEGTQNIVLESAFFDPQAIRRASKNLSLRTESSSRFEKGIDPSLCEQALEYACSLILENCGGIALSSSAGYGGKSDDKVLKIKISDQDVLRILGIKLSPAKIKSILSSLGFEPSGKNPVICKVPSWRIWDVKNHYDLIEEIGRMLDYNTFEKTLPITGLVSPKQDFDYSTRRSLKKYLQSAGYSEILTYSFYGDSLVSFSAIPKAKHYKLTNPVNEEYPYMRSSLLPWMIDKISKNSSVLTRDEVKIFEIGKVFQKDCPEKWQAAIGLMNIKMTQENLYRSLRGICERFFNEELVIEKNGKEFCCFSGKNKVASIYIYEKGEVDSVRMRSCFGVCVIHIDQLKAKQDKTLFAPIPFYPCVERDLGVIAPCVVKYKELEKEISGFDSLIKKVELFDVYHGLDDGESMGFRITFYSTDRTLESKEVDEIIEKIKISLSEKFGASFR